MHRLSGGELNPLLILKLKGGCLLDTLSNMNNALIYIEEHLTDEIGYSKVSKIAYCSEYHCKRMFSLKKTVVGCN